MDAELLESPELELLPLPDLLEESPLEDPPLEEDDPEDFELVPASGRSDFRRE